MYGTASLHPWSSSSRAGIPLCCRERGEAAAVTVSSRLVDSLLQTSYGRRLSPFVQTVRDGGIPVYRPGAKDLAGLENLLGKIGEEMDYREPEWEQVVQLHLLEIFLMLGRLSPLTERAKASFEKVSCVWSMADVTEYLKNHYDDSFTLDDLASRCALNASYFSRTFKSHAGVPLFEYINRLRIERACGLLRDTESSVLDIALAVGYNNVSFFNRYFRRLMQMSPGEYRKRIRK